MSDVTRMLADTAERLLSQHCTKAVHAAAESGTWPAALWNALEESGLTLALAPEEAGGVGLRLLDVLGLIRIAARHAAPVPLAETLCGNWMAASCGLPVEPGAVSIAPVMRAETLRIARLADGWHLTGRATRVPWARHAARLAVLALAEDGAPHVALVPRDAMATISGHQNTALEPRDTITLDVRLPSTAAARFPGAVQDLRAMGASMRTAQIAGGLERALDLCVTYAQQRVQFGRAIGKFQAIQHSLAALAAEAAAASAAVGLAAEGIAGTDMLRVAAAKGRASEAASIGAAIAHQSHGAIGFTWEYPLNLVTRRLWSWRDEFGNEGEWYPLVAGEVITGDPAGVWPRMTRGAAEAA